MPLDIKKPGCLPSGIFPQAFFEDAAAGLTRPALPVPELKKEYAAEHQARYSQPPFQALFSSPGQDAREHQFSCFHGFAAAPGEVLKSSQKRLLIFDQSGNQSRLLRCALPVQYPPTVYGEPGELPDSRNLGKRFRKDNFIPDKILVGENIDENHLNSEESEMHEDTEEINALLYSDEDYNDDDCESDDEVMSTGHSPYPIEEVCYKIGLEEINCDDGSRKSQKLLDGGYCKSSFVDTESSRSNSRPVKDENLLQSISSSKQDMGSGLSDEQSKKDKIRTALRILESIVPGAKGKEALLLLDEAIDYLKLLKQSVKSLGVSRC